jgi:hypothetical protein
MPVRPNVRYYPRLHRGVKSYVQTLRTPHALPRTERGRRRGKAAA